ncbi:MAG: formylglycine-generating enzyme family protein [Granulosicoccus sp.]
MNIADGVSLCFIRIPAGEFMMGSRGYSRSEEPMHRVAISSDFYLGTTPVTQKQARVMMERAGIEHKNHFDGREDHPAESLSANDADRCCQRMNEWLAEQSGQFVTGLPEDWQRQFELRLPSEAEWEYACKYGVDDHLEYHTGDGVAALQQAGWFGHGASFGDGLGNASGSTQPVATRQPTVAGLHDMHGNVWEWCRDVYDSAAYRHRADGTVDPLVEGAVDAYRVLRGGSWFNHATRCRAACRFRDHPVNRSWGYGFRVGLFPVRSTRSDQPAD